MGRGINRNLELIIIILNYIGGDFSDELKYYIELLYNDTFVT